MRRRLLWVLGGVAVMAVSMGGLGGCSAGDLFGIIGDVTGGSNDNNLAAIAAKLAGNYTVTSYSGTDVGSVSVPTTSNMHWRLNTDGSFAVSSTQPVSTSSGIKRTYDEGGTWRVINGTTATLGFTFTRLGGSAVPATGQAEVTGIYALIDNRQLVLRTAGIGPGLVRYVMNR